MEFQRFNVLSTRMSPAAGMHDFRPAHLFVSRIAVALQNAFKLSQKPLRAFTSAAQPEIEDYAAAGCAVLPQVRLMIFAAAIVHLHSDRRLIRLNIGAVH